MRSLPAPLRPLLASTDPHRRTALLAFVTAVNRIPGFDGPPLSRRSLPPPLRSFPASTDLHRRTALPAFATAVSLIPGFDGSPQSQPRTPCAPRPRHCAHSRLRRIPTVAATRTLRSLPSPLRPPLASTDPHRRSHTHLAFRTLATALALTTGLDGSPPWQPSVTDPYVTAPYVTVAAPLRSVAGSPRRADSRSHGTAPRLYPPPPPRRGPRPVPWVRRGSNPGLTATPV